MKHIKGFNQINFNQEEKVDEGVKEWILAGALTLASVGGAKSQGKSIMSPQINKEYVSKQQSLTIDFGSEFESGRYNFSKEKAKETQSKLSQIADFVKKYKNNEIEIIIEGSESLVPNIDAETGKRLPKGGLSKMRVAETKDLIESYMNSLMEKDIFKGTYDTLTKIGTTQYKYGEDPRQSKFTKEQYVRVTVRVKGDKVEINKYSAYSKMGERVFLPSQYGGGKAIGDIFYRTKSTEDKNDAGMIDTRYENVLLRTLNSDVEFAKTKKEYDGKMYLIPSEWWNKKQTTTNHISESDFEYIKKNFEVK